MAQAKVNELPNFIKAKTPRGLRLLMIRNNVRLKATVQYFDVQFVKGAWFAWFYEPLNMESIDDLAENN